MYLYGADNIFVVLGYNLFHHLIMYLLVCSPDVPRALLLLFQKMVNLDLTSAPNILLF